MTLPPRLIALALALAAAGAMSAPVRYEIDPEHTYPSFEADHLGISVWRGKFNRSKGFVEMDREAGTGTLEVVIDMDSVDFGHDAMNEGARSDGLFDTAKYPTAVYRGRLVDFHAGEPQRVQGTLTLRGVTRPLDLTIHRFRCIPHPLNRRELCGADASATFQRDAFGIDAGKMFGFSMDVLLRIQVEAIEAARR